MCDYFPMYDINADKQEKYMIKCFDFKGKCVSYHITKDLEEVKKIKKIVFNCEVYII